MYKTRKKIEFDVCEDYFYGLSHNQKLAIIYFLSVIAACKNNVNIKNDSPAFIDHCYKVLKLTGEQVLEYVAIGGREQTVSDLKKMNPYSFVMLIATTAELCELNGGLSEEQYTALVDWLNDMEKSIDEWKDYALNEQNFV